MRRLGWLLLASVFALLAGCDRLPALGGEGEPCFGNGSCESAELVCREDLCVREADGGTDGGDAGHDAGFDAGVDGGGDALPDGGDDAGSDGGGDWPTDAGGDWPTDAGGDWPTDGGGDWPVDGGDAAGPPSFLGFQVLANPPAGTHWVEVTAVFSEPVRGLAQGGVRPTAGNSGVLLTRFQTDDGGITWRFLVVGLYGGLTVSLGLAAESITDLDGLQLTEGSYSTTIDLGGEELPLYVNGDPTVGDDGSGHLGTISDPFLTIGRALTALNGVDQKEILVAGQDANQQTLTYSECIELPSGIGLMGGFNSDFSFRDPESSRPLLDCRDPAKYSAVKLLGSDPHTMVDGFDLVMGRTGTGANVVADLEGEGVLSRCRVLSPTSPGPADSIGVRVLSGTPMLLGNTIDGTQTGASDSRALEVIDGAPLVFGNTFTGCSGSPSLRLFGVWSEGAPLLDGNAFAVMPTCANPFTAVFLTGIFTGGALVANNRIHLGSSTSSTESFGVYLKWGAHVALVGNTIFAAVGIGIQMEGANPELINNCIFCNATNFTVAIAEVGDASDPVSLQNNLICYCANPYRDEGGYDYDYTTYESTVAGTVVDDGTCGGACPFPRVGGNVTVSTPPADVFLWVDMAAGIDAQGEFGNDWRLKADAPETARRGGLDLSTSSCGLRDFPRVCPVVPTDAAGEPRSAPLSIGAYEQDN